MFPKFTALLPLAAVLSGSALAVPDVTASQIPGGCAAYPSGPFLVNIVNSGNASIEGFGDTSNYVLGPSGVRFSYITFPDRDDIAKNPFQCTEANGLEALLESGVGSLDYKPLSIAPIPYDATMGYGFGGDETPVKAFTHSIAGVQQDGVYLGGYDNSTTWGVRYEEDAGARGQSFFYIRLLGPDSADPSTGSPLFPNEFTAFIKVAA